MGYIVGFLFALFLYSLNPPPMKFIVKWMFYIGIAATILGKIGKIFVSSSSAGAWNSMAIFHLFFIMAIPAVLVIGAILGLLMRWASSKRNSAA